MLFSIIIFVITLLVLVLIHEFGHFIMAKRFGIKVEEFGFGIPPRLWGKKIGETIYSLNWLPFGGFVRLLGEDEPGNLAIKRKGPEQSRDFRAKPVSQRIIVVIAGVTMNLVLAWVLFYTVIVSQNFKIIYPTLEPAVYIAKLERNFPAEQAGIQVGDRLISLNGQEAKDIEETRKFIRSRGEQPLSLKLSDADGNNIKTVEVTPKKGPSGDALIGVIFSPIPFREYKTPAEKIFSGITYSWDLTKVTFAGLGMVFKDVLEGDFGQASKSVAGPVGLAVVTNEILSSGWAAVLPFLWFIGVISLTLAIFNVLPIPALDGGRLLFLIIEAVSGKSVRGDIEKMVHQVGFIILLALALLITFSDIRKLLP